MSEVYFVSCEACQERIDEEQAIWLNGELAYLCDACRVAGCSADCHYCERGYMTIEGLAEGCMEEDARIRKDAYGRWICDECREAVRIHNKWEGAHMRYKQRKEESL